MSPWNGIGYGKNFGNTMSKCIGPQPNQVIHCVGNDKDVDMTSAHDMYLE